MAFYWVWFRERQDSEALPHGIEADSPDDAADAFYEEFSAPPGYRFILVSVNDISGKQCQLMRHGLG